MTDESGRTTPIPDGRFEAEPRGSLEPNDPAAADDERLFVLLNRYVDLLHSDDVPSRSTLFVMHPELRELLAALDGPSYVVRRSLHDAPHIRKAKKAVRLAFEAQVRGLGFSLVELLSTCPTNWGMNPAEACDWVAEAMIPAYPPGDYKVIEALTRIRA